MTNYEAVKRMSLEEMAAMLYLFAKPMLDGLEATKEDREKLQKSIREFLTTEVKEHEGTN